MPLFIIMQNIYKFGSALDLCAVSNFLDILLWNKIKLHILSFFITEIIPLGLISWIILILHFPMSYILFKNLWNHPKSNTSECSLYNQCVSWGPDLSFSNQTLCPILQPIFVHTLPACYRHQSFSSTESCPEAIKQRPPL